MKCGSQVALQDENIQVSEEAAVTSPKKTGSGKKSEVIIVIIAFIVLAIAFYALWQNNDKESVEYGNTAALEYGNTAGNLANGGFIVEKDDWIYYANGMDDGKLYKMRKDESEVIKLNEDKSQSINIVGDWIYYIKTGESTEGGNFYKMRTDGTEQSKLNDDIARYIIVVGDWIYYINESDESKLYKIRTDGTNSTKLNDDASSEIVVIDDWIYYTDSVGLICKMRTDGKNRTKLNDEAIASKIVVVEDWIYYANTSGLIGKMRTDGTEESQWDDVSVMQFNVVDDWIYYINWDSDSFLNKMRTDGTERTKLNDISASSFNIVGDWIYYSKRLYMGDPEDAFKIYKMRTDGSEHQITFANQLGSNQNDNSDPTYNDGSKRPFTKADCNVLGVKIDMTEAEIIKILGTPNNRTAHEMDQEEFPGISQVELEYSFGILYLMGKPGSEYLFNIRITSDNVEGPRGIRVGDRIESALDKFPIEQDPVNNYGVLYSRDNSTGTFYDSNNEQHLTYYDGAGGYGDYGIGFKAVNGVITEIGVSVGVV